MAGTLDLPKHPFTPDRPIGRRQASPGTPYSPAEEVAGFGTPEAKEIAKKATAADELLARAKRGLVTPPPKAPAKAPGAPVKKGGKSRRGRKGTHKRKTHRRRHY